MKRLVKTSLATALALATGQAMALGLGPIQVRSGLNQPLVAEIPVLADSPAETNELRVALASAEDFQRVGLSRGRVGVPIEFAVSSNGRGQTVIKLSTKEIVREPFLDFLIEVNWSKGKLLREYTVLLDPPVTAPAIVTSSKPVPRVISPAPVERAPASAAPAPSQARAPVTASPPAAAAAPRATPSAPRPSASGEYGPVQRGQALSSIARGLDVTTSANLNQVMLALLKANPNAFYRDNVNALKTGAVLRIPSSEEISAIASLKEAAAVVQAQTQTWTASARPTQVNQAGTPTSTPVAATPAAASSKSSAAGKADRLALVPPQSGKGSESGSGVGGGGSSKDAEARAELSRTRETLATREQESTDLKSRVKQLEDINDKGQHLISLKDSEIADLQNKLSELQAKASTAPAKPIETAPMSVATPKTEALAPATKPADASAKPLDIAVPPVKTAEPVPARTDSAAPTAASPATAPDAVPASTPVASTPPATVVTAMPQPDGSSPAASNAPGTPALAEAPTLATPATKPAVKPAPVVVVEKPWWSEYLGDSPYPLYGLGALLLLLGAWAASKAFGKPKGVRPAYQDDNADAMTTDDVASPASEQQLLDHLAEHPDDVDASMELLRHYYVQGDVTHFDALAETLHHQVAADSHQWAEAVAMGEDLSPHHHLFAATAVAHAPDGVIAEQEYDTVVDQPRPDLDTQRFEFEDFNAARADSAVHLDNDAQAAHDHAQDAMRREEIAHGTADVDSATHVRDHDLAAGTPVIQDNATEFFAGEDTISTRLDLARAYLDMGDPEGARSMLDEVLAEGNSAQKEEARKLLAEIR